MSAGPAENAARRNRPSKPETPALDVTAWRTQVVAQVHAGVRFAGLFATAGDHTTRLTALLVNQGGAYALDADLHGDQYPSLTRQVPAAFWYERAMHDLSGVVPTGHPRLDPLLLPLDSSSRRPLPGGDAVGALTPAESKGPADVTGEGMFTIPHGPVRSGVFESVEYLIESPGEDIPHLNIRPYYKHRGIAKSFEGRRPLDAVLVAERVEGISSVAHALAFCHAVEEIAEVEIQQRPGLVRVLHAELERLANHLDVAMRLCDAAGLAVATARFGWHKEAVMRLVSGLCGNRFGRGVIVPGGTAAYDQAPDWAAIGQAVEVLRRRVDTDATALMRTASFLDRLRGTGPLARDLARERGALGPIGRASGVDDDHRRLRPYDGYRELDVAGADTGGAGDAQSRLAVRWQEVAVAFDLICACTQRLGGLPVNRGPRELAELPDGRGVGFAESAQGEVLHSVRMRDGLVRRCFARSASFHNLPLFHDVFQGDVFTDFPFIEASFGLSVAGVAM